MLIQINFEIIFCSHYFPPIDTHVVVFHFVAFALYRNFTAQTAILFHLIIFSVHFNYRCIEGVEVVLHLICGIV